MARKASGGTPATDALARAGIDFALHSYEHDDQVTSYGLEAATALGIDADRVFKTLVVDTGAGLAVGVVPVAGKLDLKAAASALGVKKVALADPQVASRSSGYVVGGISPVGQRTPLPTVVDESAVLFETILVSGGKRGLDIELAPDDLLRVTGAAYADIAR